MGINTAGPLLVRLTASNLVAERSGPVCFETRLEVPPATTLVWYSALTIYVVKSCQEAYHLILLARRGPASGDELISVPRKWPCRGCWTVFERPTSSNTSGRIALKQRLRIWRCRCQLSSGAEQYACKGSLVASALDELCDGV